MGKISSLAHLQKLPAPPLPSTVDPSPPLQSPLSPASSYYPNTMDAFSLFVRVNRPIASNSMESLLKNLSNVSGLTILNFHEEKNGLYEFKYPRECGPEVFPLSYKQERQLLDIGVQSLYCKTYEFHLAFDLSATDYNLPSATSQSQLSPAPPYFGAVIGDYSSLFVRVDCPITSVETFEHDLKSIVGLTLNFYAEEDGCYEFKFKYPLGHEVFPLNREQERKLLNIGVQLLKCGTYLLDFESTQSHKDTSSPKPEPPISDDGNMSECL